MVSTVGRGIKTAKQSFSFASSFSQKLLPPPNTEKSPCHYLLSVSPVLQTEAQRGQARHLQSHRQEGTRLTPESALQPSAALLSHGISVYLMEHGHLGHPPPKGKPTSSFRFRLKDMIVDNSDWGAKHSGEALPTLSFLSGPLQSSQQPPVCT